MNIPDCVEAKRPKVIEAVIVCVNYADFLAYTLPMNMRYFTKLVVVTTPEDIDTIRLCEIYGVECVKTNSFYHGGAAFNKANGINAGLARLSLSDYVIHMDADIWFHPMSIKNLYSLELEGNKLYGCDRIMIESFTDYLSLMQMPDIYKGDWLMDLSAFKVGSRITQYWNGQNYQVLGFFQMWNPNISKVFYYPNESEGADKSDIQFSYMWPRKHRILLPDMIAVHLENEVSQTGKNWYGRKTARFGV